MRSTALPPEQAKVDAGMPAAAMMRLRSMHTRVLTAVAPNASRNGIEPSFSRPCSLKQPAAPSTSAPVHTEVRTARSRLMPHETTALPRPREVRSSRGHQKQITSRSGHAENVLVGKIRMPTTDDRLSDLSKANARQHSADARAPRMAREVELSEPRNRMRPI